MLAVIIILLVLLLISSNITSFMMGYFLKRKPKKEIKTFVFKRKKTPGKKEKEALKELDRQLYNIEHYDGSDKGMLDQCKGGGKR